MYMNKLNQADYQMEIVEDLGYIFPTKKSKVKARYAMFKCECGNVFRCVPRAVAIKSQVSCGCHKAKVLKEVRTTHGDSKSRLYKIRIGMIRRCNKKSSAHYDRYGGRGIQICDEWKNSYDTFKAWALANGYSDDLEIDRINNDGNYEPSNCRWTTRNIQGRNTVKLRKTNKSGYRGVSYIKDRAKYRASISVDNKSIGIGRYSTAIEAANAYDNYITINNYEHTKNFT